MPIDANIPLSGKSPDFLQSLSGLVNTANGINQFKLGNIDVQKATQANNERVALQQFTAKPENWQTDGKIDMDKINATVPKIAPYTGSDFIGKLSALSTAQTGAASAKQALTQDQRKIVSSTLGVLGRAGVNDPGVYASELENLKAQNPDNKDLGKLVDSYKTVLGHLSDKDMPSKWAVRVSQGLMTPTEQQSSLSPTIGLTNSGDKLLPTVTQPAVAGNQPALQTQPEGAIPLHIQPGQQQTVMQTPSGDLGVVTRAPTGQIIGSSAVPGGGAGPGVNRFTLPPGETTQTMNELQGQRNTAFTVANQAPVMHDINRTVIEQVNKGVVSGAAGGVINRIKSIYGGTIPDFLGGASAEKGASDYDILGKMLERSALTAAQGMGPQTNAGLEAQIKANGSVAYNPSALKKIANLNDALVSGSEMYRAGLENAIQQSGSIFAKRDFDKKWASVATPQVLRFKNAVDHGNQEEVKSILDEVGGRNSAGARKLHMQLQGMMKLTGQ